MTGLLVADRLGDPTARRLGRRTLNPLPRIDAFDALALLTSVAFALWPWTAIT